MTRPMMTDRSAARGSGARMKVRKGDDVVMVSGDDRGKQVDIVTSERSIGSFLGATTGPPVFRRLFSKGVRVNSNLKVVRLESSQAVAMNVWSEREEVLGPYDAFVYSYGGEAVCDLDQELKGKVPRLELIGDCFAPRSLQHAILEGHKLAREL